MTIPQAFQLALQHHQAGRLAEAESLYRQILAAQPNHADALHHLGVIAHQSGRGDLAVEWIRQSIVLDPNNPAAHSNLGEAFRAMGQYDKAIASLNRAIEIKPDYPDAHNNLGNTLRDQGQLDGAMAAYGRAIELEPDLPEAHMNLANALRDRGRLDEAVAAYRRALELKPDYAVAHNNLGAALTEQGRVDEAMARCRHAIELNPDLPEAHNNLGNALRDRGQFDEAVAAYRHAIKLKPGYPDARNNLGGVLALQGKLDEAIAVFRHALQLEPDDARAHSNLIYTLHFHPRHDGKSVAEEHRRWNRQFSQPQNPFILPHANDHSMKRSLRIGYVSPEFRDHVTGRYLVPLFQQHDRGNFEITCYAGVVRPDKLTDEFRRNVHQWRSTVGVGDELLAKMIRQDGIDILVDLTQHMAGNRLPMFARTPAPVQVSFAGYPESTGLEEIEYRISDPYLEVDPVEERSGRKERVHLIDSFWCYDPCGIEVNLSGLPGIDNGRVTFGCLGNFCKINERVLALWARVLGMVKDSRLLIWSPAGSHRERTLDALRSGGVQVQRVEFVEHRPRREYLALYHRLDIVLDTFPYNGHTTSLDALWMGVPVVSLAGETPVSRAGLSLLTNLGLPELAAHSEEDYVKAAVELAGDLTRLRLLRSSLRDRMKSSVLMDAPRFARQIEQAYREMWLTWCASRE